MLGSRYTSIVIVFSVLNFLNILFFSYIRYEQVPVSFIFIVIMIFKSGHKKSKAFERCTACILLSSPSTAFTTDVTLNNNNNSLYYSPNAAFLTSPARKVVKKRLLPVLQYYKKKKKNLAWKFFFFFIIIPVSVNFQLTREIL